ncbi:MAG: twin-arginine translocase subunit TatC, partial [Myxococcales bacterium]|nr:twin-arginine translocase subunit TatC [Myxococcales bacterium]
MADVPEDDATMPLLDHLEELRKRLIRAFIGVGVAAAVCWAFAEQLFRIFSAPLQKALPQGSQFIFTEVTEPFFIYMKVAGLAGLFLASPYLFYQLWAFVAPGLHKHERRYAIPFVIFSTLFFTAGSCFGYFVMFPFAFPFFLNFGGDFVTAMPTMQSFFSLAVRLLFAFGLIFEMPLAVFFLARVGIVTAAQMRQWRRYAVIGAFVVGAILT